MLCLAGLRFSSSHIHFSHLWVFPSTLLKEKNFSVHAYSSVTQLFHCLLFGCTQTWTHSFCSQDAHRVASALVDAVSKKKSSYAHFYLSREELKVSAKAWDEPPRAVAFLCFYYHHYFKTWRSINPDKGKKKILKCGRRNWLPGGFSSGRKPKSPLLHRMSLLQVQTSETADLSRFLFAVGFCVIYIFSPFLFLVSQFLHRPLFCLFFTPVLSHKSSVFAAVPQHIYAAFPMLDPACSSYVNHLCSLHTNRLSAYKQLLSP